MVEKQSPSSRRLLVMFVAQPLCGGQPAWLGWRMVDQDGSGRALACRKARPGRRTRRGAMQRILAEAEDRLTTFSTAPTPAAGLGDGYLNDVR